MNTWLCAKYYLLAEYLISKIISTSPINRVSIFSEDWAGTNTQTNNNEATNVNRKLSPFHTIDYCDTNTR